MSGDRAEKLCEPVLCDALAEFPFAQLTVTGCCMEPVLREGASVRLVSSARREPRMGDIVLVRQSAGLRLHRLVWGPPFASADGRWRTMADRARSLDEPIRRSDVMAIALVSERCAGRAARTLRSLARVLLRKAGAGWRRRKRTEAPAGEPPSATA